MFEPIRALPWRGCRVAVKKVHTDKRPVPPAVDMHTVGVEDVFPPDILHPGKDALPVGLDVRLAGRVDKNAVADQHVPDPPGRFAADRHAQRTGAGSSMSVKQAVPDGDVFGGAAPLVAVLIVDLTAMASSWSRTGILR